MKKVFLSLAALAFVATGSLTMTSCGSDDSSPVNNGGGDNGGGNNGGGNNGGGDNGGGDDSTPIETSGFYTFDGDTFEVDNARFLLHSTNGQSPTVVNFAAEGEEMDVRSVWTGIIYNTDDIATAPHYYQFSFTVPAQQTETGWTILFPNEVEETEISPRGVYAEYDLQPLNLGTINQGGVFFNTFVYTAEESLSSNESLFGANNAVVISHEYDGEFENIYFQNLMSSGRGTTATYKHVNGESFTPQQVKNMKAELAR